MRTIISLIFLCTFCTNGGMKDITPKKYSLPILVVQDDIYKGRVTPESHDCAFEVSQALPLFVYKDFDNDTLLFNAKQQDSLTRFLLHVFYDQEDQETFEGRLLPFLVVNSSEYDDFIINPLPEDSLPKVILPVFILNNADFSAIVNTHKSDTIDNITSPVFRLNFKEKSPEYIIDGTVMSHTTPVCRLDSTKKSPRHKIRGNITPVDQYYIQIYTVEKDSLAIFTISNSNLSTAADEFIDKAQRDKYVDSTEFCIYINLDGSNFSDKVNISLMLRDKYENYKDSIMYNNPNFQNAFIKHRDVLFRTYIRSNSVTYNYHILDNFLELLPEKQAIYLKKPPTDFYKYDEKGGNPAEDIILESFYEKTYNYPSE